MPKSKSKPKSSASSSTASVRVLPPAEYPTSITAARGGGYPPDVRFAAVHPLGLYHVEHMGAGHHQAVFTPKRRGSRPVVVGGASSLAGALRRISDHEDRLVEPDAPREEGQRGPVSIFSLGQRTQGKKTPTQLDREIEAYLSSQQGQDDRGSR